MNNCPHPNIIMVYTILFSIITDLFELIRCYINLVSGHI